MDTPTSDVHSWLSGVMGADFKLEKHSYSNQADVFRVLTSNKSYYLKIAIELRTERDNLRLIQPYISVPEVIDFTSLGGKDLLLMSEIVGKNLAEYISEWTKEDIVWKFAQAIRDFHELDVAKIFPGSTKRRQVVLHGDIALPNIIFTEKEISGYIDLGRMSAGLPDQDLADAIWSLQRNIGPEYGELFLENYGPTPMTSKIEAALQFRYNG